MRLSYEVFRRKDGAERLCETYTFDSLGAFLYVDFFHGMRYSCLLAGGKYSNYCERPLKEDKICRDVGARKRYDDKCKTDPVWLTYNRAYKAHYARYLKKKMTTSQFEQWSRYAVELRDKAEAGVLPYEEYYALIRE